MAPVGLGTRFQDRPGLYFFSQPRHDKWRNETDYLQYLDIDLQYLDIDPFDT